MNHFPLKDRGGLVSEELQFLRTDLSIFVFGLPAGRHTEGGAKQKVDLIFIQKYIRCDVRHLIYL